MRITFAGGLAGCTNGTMVAGTVCIERKLLGNGITRLRKIVIK